MKTSGQKLEDWKAQGQYLSLGLQNWNVFVQDLGNKNSSAKETLLLLHGFPESSYSFHAVLEGLLGHFKRLVLFDFVGFGWSDKPCASFSYSLLEQTDIALSL